MITPAPKWMTEGICAQTDPDQFFPERGHSATDAKRLCYGCPVRHRCLDYALSNNERFGIWGGLSEHERSELASGRRNTAVARTRDYTEADRLLSTGEHSTAEVAEITGLPISTVYRRREHLNLEPRAKQRTLLSVYAELSQAAGEGHRVWSGGDLIAVQGRHYRPARLAFLVGHGREPEGHVKATCGLAGCVASAHLADQVMRMGRVRV